ncbi:MAG: hypothetical protein ABW118_08505 [Candidatus Thiodiazotropha sp.]
MDIGQDAKRNREEADEWKRRVEEDPSLAPEGNKHIQKGSNDIEERMKEMEEKVDHLFEKGSQHDRQQTADQSPETSVIAEHRGAFSGVSPDTGLGLS